MTTLTQDLQEILDKELSKKSTQMVMLQVQSGDGRVVFKGAAGAATPDAPSFIASISKTYTAALIMQLADEGKISLDQTAQSLLPKADLSKLHIINGVAHGPKVTVRQLIHQTSGLADYFAARVLGDMKQNKDQSYGLAEVLRWAEQSKPLGAPNDDRSYYSDTNFQLLGAIIESVTGQSYNAALQEHICAPLGLSQTAVCGSGAFTNDALPVYYGDTRLSQRLTLASMAADGGIVSTTDELLTFLRAFMANQLFDPSNASVMQQWNPLSFPLRYGYGLMRFKLPRWMTLFRDTPEFIGHSGASGSFAFHVPEHDLYVGGTFNQLDQGRRPFTGFLIKVLNSVAKHGVSK